MGDHLINSVTSIAVAIVGIAFLAVLVSKNANTTGVISASGSAFAKGLSAAEAPVTGSGFGFNTDGSLSYGN
jgi:hypothetical protein